MESIEIKNPAIDQEKVATQLQEIMAQIPDVGDLNTSGPPQLHTKTAVNNSATELILPLMNYIPKTILKETRFTSPTPVIGPLMVKLRYAWNWMSTKWYVLPVLMQQSNINADFIMFLVTCAQIQERQATRITELERRLAQLENQLQQDQE